jgi:hypothetical protein
MMLQAQSMPTLLNILEKAPSDIADMLLVQMNEVYEPATVPFIKKKVEQSKEDSRKLYYLRLISEIPSYSALRVISETQEKSSPAMKDSIEVIKQHFFTMTKKLISMEETTHRQAKVNMMWENLEKVSDPAFRDLIIENAMRKISTTSCITSLALTKDDFPRLRQLCALLCYNYAEGSFIDLMKMKIMMLLINLKSE